MRITSQMMLSRYKSDVGDAYASMNKAMRHAYDYRSFDLPSDDPLAASQTFEIHSEMSSNDDYAQNITNINGQLTSGEKILQNIDSMLSDASGKVTLAKSGSTNSSGRGTYADQLLDIRDNIVAQLNTKYADSYIFSGSGSGSPPFELVKDTNQPELHPENDKLYYRGVNVDTGLTKAEESTAASYLATINDTNPSTTAAMKATAQTNLNNLNTTGAKRLTDLTSDPVLVDIGLGMRVDPSTGKIDPQSAYNKSIPGISFIGSGKDATGMTQNVCSLLTQVASVLKKSQSEQSLSTDEQNTIDKYMGAFTPAQNTCQAGQAGLGNKLQFLNSTSDYVSDMKTNLAERDDAVEYVSPYDAIETFYQQLYCYNAAIKVGSQILQQSLIDYLK